MLSYVVIPPWRPVCLDIYLVCSSIGFSFRSLSCVFYRLCWFLTALPCPC